LQEGKIPTTSSINFVKVKKKNNKVLKNQQASQTVTYEEDSILRGIIEHTGAMMAYFDLDFNFVVANSAYAKGAGYSTEELIGKNHFALFPNKENQIIFEKVKKTGTPEKFIDKPFEYAGQPNRGITYWDWTLSPVKDSKGKVQGLVLTLIETTERKKAEEILKESEERLNMAQKIAHIGSWEYYAKEDRAIWSEELFRIFGLEPQKYGPDVNKYVKLLHPEDKEKINCIMEKVLFKGNVGDKASFDYRIIRPDGSVRTIHSERVIREVDQYGCATRIMGAEQDITERKQIEEKLEKYSGNLEKIIEERTKQLKNAERLAAIGQTAGMVGHDLRNPLQAIIGEVYLAKTELKLIPENEYKKGLQENIQAIAEQISYMDKIVSDLQTFVKPIEPLIQIFNLKPLIVTLLAQADIPKNVQTNLQIDDTLFVKADPQLLKRVLINLVTNSLQAMPEGGKLTIKARNENKKYVQIIVKDTGVGIPEKVKPNLFTPLFTTKSKGQGFGLAVCKRVIEAQGGTINFASQEGKGTKFIVKLPA
jgi:PAS domain S-box-containing protein